MTFQYDGNFSDIAQLCFDLLNSSAFTSIEDCFPDQFDYSLAAAGNQGHDDLYLNLNPLSIILIVLYSLVFLVGLFGNVCVIVVIVKFKTMRTLTNFFLLNLTFGDLLVILICIPVNLGHTIYQKWIYGEVLCKMTPFIQGSAVGVSALSLLMISVSRYFAIYKPLTAKIIFSTRNVRIMLAGTWFIAFASLSPLLYVNSVITPIPGIQEIKYCLEQWQTKKDRNIYNMFIFCILFVWPFIFMSVTYSVIGYTLWIGNKLLFKEDSKTHVKRNNQILKQRRRTVKMLVCVIALFVFSWLPYYVVNFWLDFNMDKVELSQTIHTYVYPLVLLLALMNSAVNPVVYCFLSNGFRRGFKNLFCHGLRKKSGSLFRSSFKVKTTMSESVDTANV